MIRASDTSSFDVYAGSGKTLDLQSMFSVVLQFL